MEHLKGKGSIAQNFLSFQCSRQLTNLFKFYLEDLEQLKAKHQIMLSTVKKDLTPEQFKLVENCDYFNESQFQLIRKRIMSRGNDSIRDLLSIIERFDISFDGNIKEL